VGDRNKFYEFDTNATFSKISENVIKNKSEVTCDSLGRTAHIVLDPESED